MIAVVETKFSSNTRMYVSYRAGNMFIDIELINEVVESLSTQ